MDGGEGFDAIAELGDQDFTLTNSQIVSSIKGTDSLVDIEQVQLTGGATANVFDAATYTGRLVIYGGDGDDTINAGSGNDLLLGEDGNDEINAGGGNDLLNGGKGNDVLNGNDANDVLRGGAGTDMLSGGEGDDLLQGQAGHGDLLYGNGGNDTLSGGTGSDSASGGDGDDVLQWSDGEGNDVLNGDDGNDTLTVVGSNSSNNGDNITVRDRDGRVVVSRGFVGIVSAMTLSVGSTEVIDIDARAGNDTINATELTSARLVARGGDGNDTITGSSQADDLQGGNGSDVISGKNGADVIDGGADTDEIHTEETDASDSVLNSQLDLVFSSIDDLVS